jgi:predicted DNA-binding transcriptional regulator AlpA
LPRTALVNRADIAYIADVTIETVQSWTSSGFPPPTTRTGVSGLLYEIGPVTDWLCATGRMACGLTDPLMTRREIAAELGVSPETIKAWCRKGRFPGPAVRVGRTDMWDESVIAEHRKATR